MPKRIVATMARGRILTSRLLSRLGLKDEGFLVLLAVTIGLITAAAAVSFHQLIDIVRRVLYENVGPQRHLYTTGIGLLILIPAAGGLAVGFISNYVLKVREGRGLVDVLEQVSRSNGRIDPLVVLEKILTSAITIGTGGSAGAEGPIVQIGAGIASAIGQILRVSRQQMPVLIGCGSAAGISAIFNAPIGGVLFTLEVVLRDFSIRAFTPVVIASVVANYATQSIFRNVLHAPYVAIFDVPASVQGAGFQLSNLGQFALLGIICGLIGVSLTKLMHFTEEYFDHLKKIPRFVRPSIGGALLGVLGIIYILSCGKVIDTTHYAMPAFFGDGYGAVQQLFLPAFYASSHKPWLELLGILLFLIIAKIAGTCFTLGSGGSGGIIAPSLFLGAVTGGATGMILNKLHMTDVPPNAYALVGIGSVLAAVIHAPLASTLILFEVTRDYTITLPAMLACIVATATARIIFRDSIYTMSLRQRGVHVGTSGDLNLLQRLYVEQVALEPAVTLREIDPLQRAVDLVVSSDTVDFIVVDKDGAYVGMLLSGELKTALIDREAVPLLVVGEVMRVDVPVVCAGDSLAEALDCFAAHDVGRLPVAVSRTTGKIIGVLSRAALMRRYYSSLSDS
jgi:chloride channel protein, CIC family